MNDNPNQISIDFPPLLLLSFDADHYMPIYNTRSLSSIFSSLYEYPPSTRLVIPERASIPVQVSAHGIQGEESSTRW